MFCKTCGKEVHAQCVVCPHCGVATGGGDQSGDTGNVGWSFLGFFIPLVGLILYFIWKQTHPKNAKMAGKGALANIILWVVGYILIMFVMTGLLL